MQSEQKTAIINWEALKFDCKDICDDVQNKANQTFALLDDIQIILEPKQVDDPPEDKPPLQQTFDNSDVIILCELLSFAKKL